MLHLRHKVELTTTSTGSTNPFRAMDGFHESVLEFLWIHEFSFTLVIKTETGRIEGVLAAVSTPFAVAIVDPSGDHDSL